eukprot:m51a1_g2501 putative methionine aminopeptidase 2b (469) ;mRNA; r:125813-127373
MAEQAPAAAAAAAAADSNKRPADAEEAHESEDEADDEHAPDATAVDGTPEAGAGAADKKKKRKKKKKAKTASAGAAGAAGAAPAEASAAAGAAAQAPKAKPKGKKQTDPPSVRVTELFETFEVGHLMEYHQDWNTSRTTNEELRALERLKGPAYDDWRQAAEIHKEVRKWARTWLKPGLPMTTIADRIEGAIRKLSAPDALGAGIAFPCGLSVNNIAAHWTPNPGDKTVLQASDVLKVDMGVHVNGRIIDSAFTVAFDHKFDPLLEAVREATWAGVKACGVDVRLCDVGSEIQDVMESYEVELGGKTLGVKPIRNLYGHSVGDYLIHAGKSVPIVRGGEGTRMEEGDTFAIETFGSTGRGFVQDGPDCSHYMKSPDNVGAHQSRVARARELLGHIGKHHGTLAFAKRWLEMEGQQKGYQLALKALVDCGAVNPYPPLHDERGSYVAQFEHTVALKPTCKEVFTHSDDY